MMITMFCNFNLKLKFGAHMAQLGMGEAGPGVGCGLLVPGWGLAGPRPVLARAAVVLIFRA